MTDAPLRTGALRGDADTWQTARACLMVVIFPIVIPWPYVFANYVTRRDDRWG